MKRRLRFQFITDSRFTKEPEKDIDKLHDKLAFLIEHLPKNQTIKIWTPGKRKVNFSDTYQWRIDYILEKNNKITWEKIKTIINSVQAPYYQFIK